ncbi:MAG TPA: hypothetical protein VH589_27545 [Trebonia sp.]
MDLSDRCRLLLNRIADRVPADVLAEARSYGADGEWEAALIAVINLGVEVSADEEDLLNELLAELAGTREPAVRTYAAGCRHDLMVHPSHYQYYLRDEACEYDPEAAPLEEDDLVAVCAAQHLLKVHTGMYGFDLPLTVEPLDAEPPADLDAWPEVSEVSVILAGPALLIESVLTGTTDQFPLPGHPSQTRTYHVRIHATGRDEAAEAVHVSTENGDPLTERHLIQLWPAPVQPLKTLKP